MVRACSGFVSSTEAYTLKPCFQFQLPWWTHFLKYCVEMVHYLRSVTLTMASDNITSYQYWTVLWTETLAVVLTCAFSVLYVRRHPARRPFAPLC